MVMVNSESSISTATDLAKIRPLQAWEKSCRIVPKSLQNQYIILPGNTAYYTTLELFVGLLWGLL
jgi:hypothetical protein